MTAMRSLLLGLVIAVPLVAQHKTLDVYFIDVEGGQATLIVTPAGGSMLIDTGWPGYNGRDADRIAAAMKKAGVSQLDEVLITHYHMDHVGGVPQLATRVPIKEFVDHGPNNETDAQAKKLSEAYEKASANAHHRVVKPGDTISLKGAEVKVVAANGDVITQPLAGAGKANELCAKTQQKAPDPSENARSVGVLITFGKFRFIDLGDLTWNKELELACPANKIGTVDLYLTTHHGLDESGANALVDALHPKVAIMNNGARKGGSPSAWKIVSASPGLQDLWQLHRALASPDTNVPEERIANPGPDDPGNYIMVAAEQNGTFSVTNSRNGLTKQYR